MEQKHLLPPLCCKRRRTGKSPSSAARVHRPSIRMHLTIRKWHSRMSMLSSVEPGIDCNKGGRTMQIRLNPYPRAFSPRPYRSLPRFFAGGRV